MHADLLNQGSLNIDLDRQSGECQFGHDDEGLRGRGFWKCPSECLADACVGVRPFCEVARDLHHVSSGCALGLQNCKDIRNRLIELVVERFRKASVKSIANLTSKDQLLIAAGYDGKVAVVSHRLGKTTRIQEFDWNGLECALGEGAGSFSMLCAMQYRCRCALMLFGYRARSAHDWQFALLAVTTWSCCR